MTGWAVFGNVTEGRLEVVNAQSPQRNTLRPQRNTLRAHARTRPRTPAPSTRRRNVGDGSFGASASMLAAPGSRHPPRGHASGVQLSRRLAAALRAATVLPPSDAQERSPRRSRPRPTQPPPASSHVEKAWRVPRRLTTNRTARSRSAGELFVVIPPPRVRRRPRAVRRRARQR
jgi:hypothetical protein